jgi:hypothetical protein
MHALGEGHVRQAAVALEDVEQAAVDAVEWHLLLLEAD